MKKIILALICALFIGGCASKHDIILVGFNSEEMLRGTFDESNDTVTVVMPNGEILSGGYSTMDSEEPVYFSNTIGYSSSRRYHGGFGGVGIGFNFGQESTKYALLKSSNSTLKMEIIFTHRSWTKNGFGEATTNDGRVYKIQF